MRRVVHDSHDVVTLWHSNRRECVISTQHGGVLAVDARRPTCSQRIGDDEVPVTLRVDSRLQNVSFTMLDVDFRRQSIRGRRRVIEDHGAVLGRVVGKFREPSGRVWYHPNVIRPSDQWQRVQPAVRADAVDEVETKPIISRSDDVEARYAIRSRET